MADLTRREVMSLVGTAAVGTAVTRSVPTSAITRGRVLGSAMQQSACRWCFPDMELDEFFRHAQDVGLPAVDLLQEGEWDVAKQYGLTCSTGYGGAGTISDGLNDPSNHSEIVRNLELSLPKAANASVPNVIAFFGNRRGMNDAEGIDNCTNVLKRVAPVAESEDVTIVVELLNSRVNHPDYMGDHTAFGVEVIKRVDSPRVKLLYDIYHMQIMEGNVIQTIRNNHQYIAHYHTAGVPGRHELDRNQELNWRTVAQAIADTGFTGYLAHEFIPTRDPRTSLQEAVTLCNV